MNTDRKAEPNRDEILTAAAHGNAAALEFLRVFARRAHWVDDLVDEYGDDRPSECGRMAAMESEWLLILTGNPFFLAHRAQLVPAMVLALNAWVDSEAMRAGGPAGRQAGDVVKGQWHEVVWLVAWLTGGWQHLRETSSRYRSYDFEKSRDDGRWTGAAPPRPSALDPRPKESNGLPG